MTTAWRRVVLPLRPRVITPGVVVIVSVYVLVANWPDAFVYVGERNVSPRIVSPFELGSMAVGITLAVGLAPRFPDWDRYGARKTRLLALVNAVVVVVVPQAVLFSSLLLFYPSEGTPPAHALFPLAGNVAVASLLAVIATGMVGNLLGPLLWGAVLYGVMSWQSYAPPGLRWSPLSMSHTASGQLDTTPRWAWIVLGVIGALAVVWTRRSVPYRITLRAPEER